MIKPLTLSQRLLERADASDEDCRTDDGDIMREADEALKAKFSEIARLRLVIARIQDKANDRSMPAVHRVIDIAEDAAFALEEKVDA